MDQTNYQIFQDIIKQVQQLEQKPTLLLHSCCAPCSSACIQQIAKFFDITVLYYNPNISPQAEYEKRKQEQINFISQFDNSVKFMDCDYEPTKFYSLVKGLEHCEERGERCVKCYTMRMQKTCQIAKQNNFDYFASTLTLSPLKDEKVINQIGKQLEQEYSQPYLVSNFKKNNGYLNSINLSKQYNLYRQDYCGCVFSQKNKYEK